MRALKNKKTGELFPILGPEDNPNYENNRPGPKWELVKVPPQKYEGHDKVWMGNNPDFVEVIDA